MSPPATTDTGPHPGPPAPAPADPLLLDLPDTLQTARLQLRVPRPGDGWAVYEAVAESLPALRRFVGSLPWVAAEPSPGASEAFCRNGQANFLARRDLPFLVFERASGRLVACTGLHRPDWSVPRIELGYWCRSSATGQGFVAEAVQALRGYAFAQARVARLEAVVDARNTASRRVVERCGFALEGVLKARRRNPDGSLRDDCIYAVTAGSGTGSSAGS